MEILKSLIGYNVTVMLTNEDRWHTGKLKKVDSKGILILISDEPLNGPTLVYVQHSDYNQINIVKSSQNSQGVFSAFRKEHDDLFDEK